MDSHIVFQVLANKTKYFQMRLQRNAFQTVYGRGNEAAVLREQYPLFADFAQVIPICPAEQGRDNRRPTIPFIVIRTFSMISRAHCPAAICAALARSSHLLRTPWYAQRSRVFVSYATERGNGSSFSNFRRTGLSSTAACSSFAASPRAAGRFRKAHFQLALHFNRTKRSAEVIACALQDRRTVKLRRQIAVYSPSFHKSLCEDSYLWRDKALRRACIRFSIGPLAAKPPLEPAGMAAGVQLAAGWPSRREKRFAYGAVGLRTVTPNCADK